MIAQMGEIIKAHSGIKWAALTGDISCKCGARFSEWGGPMDIVDRKLVQHTASELVRAGHGKLGVGK